jgi:hypothetical protein
MTAQGLSTTETGTSVNLNFDWNANGPTLNGGTFYRIYQGTKTASVYCGGPTENILQTTITFYGKDSVRAGSIENSQGQTVDDPMLDCEIDYTYALEGWTEELEGTEAYYDNIGIALNDGAVLYGVYSKYEEMEYYPNNGEPPDVAPVFNYVYGMGTKSNNYPEEPQLFKANWKKDYWESNNDYGTWEYLWDTGFRVVSLVWTPNNTVYFGNSSWKNAKIYYGVNGEWKPAVVRFGKDGQWVGGNTI